MFRRLFSVACVLAVVLSLASAASAHAVMYPKQATANSYEKFVLRVPTEKDIPTVGVRVEVPEGFTVSRVQPLPGWSYVFERDASGTVTAVSWSGSEIGPDEFQEFVIQGKTAAEPGSYAWRAWQTYGDGSVVAWTGPSDADTPASVMSVIAAGIQTDAHGGSSGGQGARPDMLTQVAAYGGLALGAAALFVAVRRRSA